MNDYLFRSLKKNVAIYPSHQLLYSLESFTYFKNPNKSIQIKLLAEATSSFGNVDGINLESRLLFFHSAPAPFKLVYT